MLERYFKQQFAESLQYRAIGLWWEPKGMFVFGGYVGFYYKK